MRISMSCSLLETTRGRSQLLICSFLTRVWTQPVSVGPSTHSRVLFKDAFKHHQHQSPPRAQSGFKRNKKETVQGAKLLPSLGFRSIRLLSFLNPLPPFFLPSFIPISLHIFLLLCLLVSSSSPSPAALPSPSFLCGEPFFPASEVG